MRRFLGVSVPLRIDFLPTASRRYHAWRLVNTRKRQGKAAVELSQEALVGSSWLRATLNWCNQKKLHQIWTRSFHLVSHYKCIPTRLIYANFSFSSPSPSWLLWMQILSRARSASALYSLKPLSPISPSKSSSMALSLNVVSFISKIRQSPPRSKPHHIESSSGEPQTHPNITFNTYEKTGPYELNETYLCSDAVDMKLLLRLTRNTLLEHICYDGLNTLVDEQWV